MTRRADRSLDEFDEPRRPRASRRRLLFVLALASIVAIGLLVTVVFPTRAYLNQRAQTRAAAKQLHSLDVSNAALQRKIHLLETPQEVEHLAREDYGLVRPGEEAYAILPTPPPPVTLPNVWPFAGVAAALNS